MKTFYVNSLEDIDKFLKNFSEDNFLLLLIASEEKDESISKILESLNEKNINYGGGVFPGVIYNGKALWKGAVGIVLDRVIKSKLIHKRQDIEELKEYKEVSSGESVFIFIDGFMPGIETLLEDIHFTLGNTLYAGCGAGDLNNPERRSIFSREGFIRNGALVIITREKINVKVKHGWKRLYGPFLVTDAEGNRIKYINWEPAFRFYKKILKEYEGIDITRENFFEVAKAYPFGMLKEKGEDIVRDPINAEPDNAIVCVGEVPRNSVIYIMKGIKENLINAAREVTEGIRRKVLLFDCISRVLFLDKHIDKELKAACEGIGICVGCFSIGEIASYGGLQPEFFNKTIVGVIWEE